jgi:uncharacterized membrane protein
MSFNSKVLDRTLNHQKSVHGINVGNTERIASAIAGGALAIYGLSRRSTAGLLAMLAGSALLHRGGTGYCNAYQALGINSTARGDSEAAVARDIHIEKSIIIDKSPKELYRFWREFENLPRFMDHLESVNTISPNRSHWKVKGPAGSTLEWDAEIYNEKPDEFIAWRSLEGEVTNAGSVHFQPATDERGTLLKVVLNYNAPGGKFSALLAKLFGQEPGQMIEEDLRRLKQVLETGEVANIEGQPSGRKQSESTTAGAAPDAGPTPASKVATSRAASAR